MTTARLMRVRIRPPATWPVSTARSPMRIVLKRAMMPSVMSFATEMAVVVAAPAAANRSMPGVRKLT